MSTRAPSPDALRRAAGWLKAWDLSDPQRTPEEAAAAAEVAEVARWLERTATARERRASVKD